MEINVDTLIREWIKREDEGEEEDVSEMVEDSKSSRWIIGLIRELNSVLKGGTLLEQR